MRKLAIVMALATTAIATPALARDDAWYIGVEGGPSIVEDASIDIGALANAGKTDNKAGYDFDGIIGYDFGGFRLESEVGYKRAGLQGYASTTTTAARNVVGGVLVNAPAGNYTVAGGNTSALSFMVNGILDFGEDDALQGFVGVGGGVARVKADYALNTNGLSFLNDSDTGFAWQAIAGIRAPINDHWDVGLKYRFFNANGVDLVDANGRANHTRYRSHSILGSIIYNFGGPAAPPPPPPPMPESPPPPPPPAPPPPPPAACTPGPYIVFFEWDKSDITAEAASILDNAVSAYGNCGNAQVMLAGHADKSGTPKYNLGLSERRNTSVRGYLSGHGIADGVISTQAFGEGAPRVETADGVRELQNRRVEITYGPGSGN
jgi:outer membrane protein OmpA-like peptidoglycan-associated protein/opacity protein-like surface antigen